MTTPLEKNLNFLEITSMLALSKQLDEELNKGKTARTAVTFWGTRTVTLGERTFSLDALTQKVEKVRDKSIWTRSSALYIISDIHNLYQLTDAQLEQKGLTRYLTKLFIYLRETFGGLGLRDHVNKEYLEDRFRAYDSEKDCRQAFDLEDPTTDFPKDRFDLLRREDGTIGRIYATKEDIHEMARTKSPLNDQLAQTILQETGKATSIGKICQEPFFAQDPVAYIIDRMLEKGVKTNYTSLEEEENLVTAYLISQIPDFVKVVTSPEYLRAYADYYFAYKPESSRKIFEKSLQIAEFQELLRPISADNSVKKWDIEPEKWETIECELRTAFTIFTQAEQGRIYQSPSEVQKEAQSASNN